MFEPNRNRWRWLGAEFTIIVLGVLSASFVDTWLQDRQDAKREEVYLERLELDLQRDLVNLDAVIQYYGNIRKHGLTVLAVLDGDRELDDFGLLFSAFNAAEEWGFLLESSTFNDLQSTGGLSLIEDVRLRLDLAEYYRQGESRAGVWNLPREYRQSVRGIIPNALQTAIHEDCAGDSRPVNDALQTTAAPGVSGTYWSANVTPSVEPLTSSASTSDTCGLDPDAFDVENAANEVRQDRELERFLRYRVSQIRVAIALFRGQQEMARELLARIHQSEN
jgi:hypothetical protein